MRLACNSDLHGVCLLVNLDVGAEILLQGLDGLPTLANHSAHNALVAINDLGNAGTILQTRGLSKASLKAEVVLKRHATL